jgi:uncharacterized protein YbjT (DUF2867 family)
MSSRTATLIGATGLIGGHLLTLLQSDDYFDTIRVLVRRPFQTDRTKTAVRLIDFEDHESYKLGIDGSDAVFVAVGTTQKKVKGDKEAYRKVDYDLPVKAARFCKETGCPQLLIVSSVGANSKSNNFYLALKGEVEKTIKESGIPSTSVFRPSMLLGNREESRPAERVGQVIMKTFSFAIAGSFRKYKPVNAVDVAKAMLQASKIRKPGFSIYEYDSIRRLASGTKL